jgi:LmbE family N-acetylglucosaminyl deacetylase
MKKRILAIGAHPDDIEIGCGGTLSLLKEQGYDLVYLNVTSGEEGKRFGTRIDTIAQRELESKRSGQILGASQVLFLREPDGLTSFSKETKIRLISIIRELRPALVLTHARSDHFPDHQIVHQLTMDAALGAAGPWYPGAAGHPHEIQEILGYEVWHPIPKYQFANDITRVIELKLQALQVHSSQVNEVDYTEAARGLARYRGVMSMKGKYAEVFEVLKSRGIL